MNYIDRKIEEILKELNVNNLDEGLELLKKLEQEQEEQK